MNAVELTEKAFAKSGETSIRAFANRVGVSHVTVLWWLEGTRDPSFEHAAELAAIAGLPIIKTASEVRANTPAGAKHKSILRQLAATATVLLCAIGLAIGAPAKAAPHKAFSGPLVSGIQSNADYVQEQTSYPAHAPGTAVDPRTIKLKSSVC